MQQTEKVSLTDNSNDSELNYLFIVSDYTYRQI